MDNVVTVRFKVPSRFKVLFEPCLIGLNISVLFADLFDIYWYDDTIGYGILLNRDNSHWFNGRTLPGPEIDSSALETATIKIIRYNMGVIHDVFVETENWVLDILGIEFLGAIRLRKIMGRINDTVIIQIEDIHSDG